MKKILSICAVLMFYSLYTPAQDKKLGFKETVNYINEIFAGNRFEYWYYNRGSIGITEITAKNDGSVTIYIGEKIHVATFNLFDVAFELGESDYEAEITLRGNNNNYIGTFSKIPIDIRKRLIKAFTHLKSLCDKSLDPFSD